MTKRFTISIIIFICMLYSEMNYAQNWKLVDSVFNPFGVNSFSFSAPFFADLDADNDFDIIMGNYTTDRIEYFENIGNSTTPKYFRDTSVTYPIYKNGLAGTNSSYAVCVDIDADDDLDLITSGYNGLLLYENIGDKYAPEWLIVENYFSEINTQIGTDPKPAFGDIDNDGDYDLLVGIGESLFGGPDPGYVFGFENTGTSTSPQFVLKDTLAKGIGDIGLNAYPVLKDLNNEGKVDLLLGRDLQTLVYFVNTGNRNSYWQRVTNIFNIVETTSYWKNPDLCDLDGDGDYDLIYGTSNGKIYYYKNKGTTSSASYQYDASYFNSIQVSGGGATISFGDFDKDGDIDFVSGNLLGKLNLFDNVGTPENPSFKYVNSALSSFSAGSYSKPVFIDFDGDDDLDVVAGQLRGKLITFLNNNGVFKQDTLPFHFANAGWLSAPAFVDIDNDVDKDLFVVGETSADSKFYINNSGTYVEDYSWVENVVTPHSGFPVFEDIDLDGDYDLVIGSLWGDIECYENIGSKTLPVWEKNETYFAGIEVSQSAAPGFADLDKDGKPEMIIGDYDGNFTYYENAMNTSDLITDIETVKNFKLYQNYPNPFNPTTKIKFTLPTAETSYMTSLRIYNVLGKEIITLIDKELSAGEYEVELSAEGGGSKLASGVYFYQLKFGSFVKTMKMIHMK
ncbi:MAG: T9SS C-terminal target domain-containing protein [Ignavibacteriales bacterium]|nr:MAG: T9SS C-terminal target domain-containing protein [Ignavibacteriales bacterium]